jgi:hypothetical protein
MMIRSFGLSSTFSAMFILRGRLHAGLAAFLFEVPERNSPLAMQ